MFFRATSLLSILAAVLVVSSVQAQQSVSDNLQNLVQTDGSLAIGDKVFSNFDYFASGLSNFDPSQIRVTASYLNGTYFLTWVGNMSLVSGVTTTSDLLLGYTVTATDGAIDQLDASYTGSGQPSGNTFIAYDETVRNTQGVVLGTIHLDQTHTSAILDINPAQTSLNITKDIGYGILNSGFISISEISQSVHQVVPEPASVALLGIGAAALGFVRRNRAS